MASSQALPEPMNASPHHSKVKVTITLPDPTFVAGHHVSGKLEMECRADRGLGIGIMMIELFAIQELSSRDHSATSTFLHSRRLFQGPGLPPSNAVQAYPVPGDPPLPQHYHQARKGHSTFLFRIPIPASSPSSIAFGNGLAKVRYELRASVGVFWKNDKRLVVDKHSIDVVEAYPYESVLLGKIPEGIVVGENGKLWMQGKVLGGLIVAGGPACLELQVKNHSTKKNTGLTLSLTRTLYLPGSGAAHQNPAPVQISDTMTVVPFRGPEYIIPPGAEGIANLVFDVPKDARGVKGGILDGEESEGGSGPRRSESLFEIKCIVEIKLTMGMGSKDIFLEIPIEIVHPIAVPPPEEIPGPYARNYPHVDPMSIPGQPGPYPEYRPYYAVTPAPIIPYMDPTRNQVWLPPPPIPQSSPLGLPYDSHSPIQHGVYPPPLQSHASQHPYYEAHQSPPLQHQPNLLFSPDLLPPPAVGGNPGYNPRPASAGPIITAFPQVMVPGLPQLHQLPLHQHIQQQVEETAGNGEAIPSTHLRISSQHRSLSSQGYHHPLPAPPVPINDANSYNLSGAAVMDVPSNFNGLDSHNLVPPGLARPQLLPATLPSPIVDAAVLHSPRPQLTPKHSFTRDPVLGVTSKSQRVGELEKMADEVARKSQDLSCDLPKDVGVKESKPEYGGISAAKPIEDEFNVDKTLPGPPVPSGKFPLSLPSRARADIYFGSQHHLEETLPLPSDQAPPTPALVAVLPSRQLKPSKENIKTENGLDALERRLLAEVGTRKIETRYINKGPKLDVRNVLPIDTSISQLRSTSIPIPAKSPEPLHDSAISSLTLAGGLAGGDDSDGEFDGRTHRAGRSRDGSSDGRGDLSTGLHMHMRERAQVFTPTKTPERGTKGKERVDQSNEELGNLNDKDKNKVNKTSGKKKDRPNNNKSAAKGRVAAWLGEIDPDIPPQEQIIPPSPSVLRDPDSTFDPAGDNTSYQFTAPAPNQSTTPGPEVRPPKAVDATPNPRSSGFIPISTLNRHSIDPRPLLKTDNSVIQEAQRVQDIWSFDSPGLREATTPPASRFIAPAASLPSFETEERGAPSSSRPTPAGTGSNKPNMPLSYSAAARNVWKGQEAVKPPAKLPPPLSTKVAVLPSLRGRVQGVFPPSSHRPVDVEVKYDIRSARGGRGGKVTSVASMWASGAISSQGAKGTGIDKRIDTIEEARSPLPTPPKEKKLFSAAVMTPSPGRKQPSMASGSASPSRPPNEAQKRPDSRGKVLAVSKGFNSGPQLKRSSPSAALSTPSTGSVVAPITKDALAQKRPATSMANLRKQAPNSLSSPTVSEPKLHGFVAKGTKPVIKATSDPAVVSSSHAVPTLSSTASLARPPISAAQFPRPVKLPTTFSTPNLVSGKSSESQRAPSPSKPADLEFGQARLRDLIKKYQGHGQKT